MKIVVSVMLVVSLAILVACMCRLFSSFHEHRLKKYFVRLHIVITETIK